MDKQQKRSYAKILIKEALKEGEENATTRADLVAITRISDRTVRLIIAELQEQDGIAICSYSARKGYFYPSNVEEALHALNEKKKRAFKCFSGSNALKKYIREQTQEKLYLEEEGL